ncbi:MAG: homocysteine S-methyltransferase family protein [Eubacterium sp.]
MIDSLVEKLEKKVVLADGAMGTYFSQKYMTEMEAEEANIATPERIIAIHKEYIEAGAELIRTNTFAVNHGLFAEAERRKEVIEAAVANAREAVRQSRKEVVVAASVGPIRQSAEEEDGEIWKEYTQMLDVFYTLGIRVFLFETFSELRWLPKLAKYCKNKEEQTVVIAELALNPMGYTQHGFGMTEILQELTSDVNFDIVGFNCGVGALHMKKLLQSQKFPKEFLLSVFPNAGYQQEMQGRTLVFHDTAYYAGQMKEILALGANLVGGCCGTTPGHIRALKKVVQNQEQVRPKKLAKENENLGEVKDNPTPFIRKLRGGKKVFVVELDAPFDASSDKFRKGVCALQENGVDIITVSDSPMARARADASLLAVYAKNARMWRLCRMWR